MPSHRLLFILWEQPSISVGVLVPDGEAMRPGQSVQNVSNCRAAAPWNLPARHRGTMGILEPAVTLWCYMNRGICRHDILGLWESWNVSTHYGVIGIEESAGTTLSGYASRGICRQELEGDT